MDFPFPEFKSTFFKKVLPAHICVFFLWSVYIGLDQFLYFTVVFLVLEELSDFSQDQHLNQVNEGFLIKRYMVVIDVRAVCDCKALCEPQSTGQI